MSCTIYVALLDEGVQVWRPVLAEHLVDSEYLILEQEYDSGLERWAFEPGETVICEMTEAHGKTILAALRRA